MSQYRVKTDDYLSQDFRAEKVANQLLIETTTAQDSSVDVGPALTRLKYDIDEIESKMKSLCREHTGDLLQHTETSNTLSTEIETLQLPLENMTGSFGKLDRDFLAPYKRADALHRTCEKLSYTAQLCRSLSWYLQLALQAQSREYRREGAISNGSAGTAMLRTAHAIRTIGKLTAEFPDLKLINTVANFEERVPDLRKAVVDSAARLLREFDGINVAQVRMASLAIVTLDADLLQIITAHVRALVGSTVLQLTRTSGSAIEHERAFGDAEQRNKVVSLLIAAYNETAAAKPDTEALHNTFWDQVASQLAQKLKTMSVANPTALKNMAANRKVILTCTQAVASVHDVFANYLNK